jgi:hypothetical protein
MDRVAGAGKEPVLAFHASREALESGLRFNDACCRSGGNQVAGFKGVRYFKTHEEANEDWLDSLARHMAALAVKRRQKK